MDMPKTMPNGVELKSPQEITIKLPLWCINQLKNMKDFVNNTMSFKTAQVGSLTLEEFLSVFIQSQVTLEGQKLNSLYRF